MKSFIRNRVLCSLILIFPISFISYTCSQAQAKFLDDINYIWITIDTESTSYWPLVDQVDTDIDGVLCGISEIMNICDKHSVKATFFLNVYEHKKFGKEKLHEIAKKIHERGHDVQLHPHPEHAYDENRMALWQYSMQEQSEIIRDGRELIYLWTGVYPIAHRAGGYFADNNTLKALENNDIEIDSSFFFQHPNNKIQNTLLEINNVKKIGKLWEVPVSLYLKKETPFDNILNLKPVERYRKIDIDWASFEDLKSALNQTKENNQKIITLFLHSFSFLAERERQPAVQDLKKFDNILSFIKENNKFQVVTSEQLNKIIKASEKDLSSNKDFVPEVMTNISLLRYVKRRYFSETYIVSFALLILIIVLIISWRYFPKIAKRN